VVDCDWVPRGTKRREKAIKLVFIIPYSAFQKLTQAYWFKNRPFLNRRHAMTDKNAKIWRQTQNMDKIHY